jgi:hypothetical protein
MKGLTKEKKTNSSGMNSHASKSLLKTVSKAKIGNKVMMKLINGATSPKAEPKVPINPKDVKEIKDVKDKEKERGYNKSQAGTDKRLSLTPRPNYEEKSEIIEKPLVDRHLKIPVSNEEVRSALDLQTHGHHFLHSQTVNPTKVGADMDIKSTANTAKRHYSLTGDSSTVGTMQIRVVSRFRPLNSVEVELSQKNMGSMCSHFESQDTVRITNNLSHPQSFTLDRIFDPNTTQKDLYEQVAKATIGDVLKGYNGTIFTYGQSGSGKTFCMYGTDIYDEVHKGVIPRSIEEIFDFINDEANKDIKFELKFSMVEIYKESLHDLLSPSTKSSELKIKEHPQKGIYVMNLTEEYISNEEEFLLMIENADEYRVVSETGLNKVSSRSHLLFQLEILQKFPDDTERRGILNLIDLAGSEKITKTHAVGETLEEAKKINLSLSTLGNVIKTLTSAKNEFVPYRDSKLTRILQDSLGGNYKTTLIVTCSPHIYNCEETISTLKFASRAKKIKNNVKINLKRSTEQLETIIDTLTKQLNLANDEILKYKNNFAISTWETTTGKESGENIKTFSQVYINTQNITNSNINSGSNSRRESLKNVTSGLSSLGLSGLNGLSTSIPKLPLEKKNSVDSINHININQINHINPIDLTNYLNALKKKDEDVSNLTEKIETLQEENKSLQEKVTKMSKETGYVYFYQILENLENLTKNNIHDIKNLKSVRENELIKSLKSENEKLKEGYHNLENKYIKTLKDLEKQFSFQNSFKHNSDNEKCFLFTGKTETERSHSSIYSSCNFDFNFEEELGKYHMNFSKFFNNEVHINNITANTPTSKSYKNIYTFSKMYVNTLLKDFLKKKEMFGSKFNQDYSRKESNAFNNAADDNKAMKENYNQVKGSFIKMNYLIVYYEKIIFELMNRVLVDISKYFINK